MTTASQKRAIRNYRRRLMAAGIVRFEVLGIESDRALLRTLARRLAKGDSEAGWLRDAVGRALSAAGAEPDVTAR